MDSVSIVATVSLMIADKADRHLLGQFLEQAGYRVQTPSALDTFTANATGNLLIVDEVSACRHGTALLAMKRQSLPLYQPMLLTVTGTASASPWLRAGFDDVLRMPLNKDDLLARLEAFLRLHQHSANIIKESAQRYRSTFDMAPVGIVHLALDGVVTLANPYFCTLLHVTGNALLGKAITGMVGPADREVMQ